MSDEPLLVPDQLYCVLLSLREDTLLLPNAAVAEAVGQDALRPEGRGPEWLAGTLDWNHRRLPTLSFEALNGQTRPALNKRSRLVVLNPVTSEVGESAFALLCQGYPHLITLSRVAVTPLPLGENDVPDYVLARVRIGNTEALIPDLDRIAALLRQARAQEAAI